MEGAVAQPKAASYTYWVREARADAAPPPAPCKLSADDLSKRPQPAATLGSVWNQAGTWVEKNLSSWASSRIKELFRSFGSLEFSSGKAYIEEVSKCSGDAFVVIVRNKKRVGYTYELSFKFKGFWLFGKEKKKIEGYLDTTEFSFGELEDLQIEVRLNEEKDLTLEDKRRICKDLKLFLNPVRDNLKKFEKSLKTGAPSCADRRSLAHTKSNGGGLATNSLLQGHRSSATKIADLVAS